MTTQSESRIRLPGKDCGLCGFRTCAEFASLLHETPEEVTRCIFMASHNAPPGLPDLSESEITWKDILGREYDFVLDQAPEDPGPRETILPFNPANVEKLDVKKGDILYGRPAAAGCPVTHCGIVVEEPDYFNGLIEWCIVGPAMARERGIDIGMYNPVAYEGIARFARKELRFGLRYYFLPRYCMLQVRHSGLLNTIIKSGGGPRVRMEGIILS